MKNIKILACFTRSYDDNHITKNIINLITSLVVVKDYDVWSSIWTNVNNNNYAIIRIVHESYFNNKNYLMEGTMKYIVEKSPQNLIIISLTLEDLLLGITFYRSDNASNMNLINQIFGPYLVTKENKWPNRINRKILFEFNNGMLWSNIVMRFKLCNINIGGGAISKRHLLSTVSFDLNFFLLKLFNDPNLVSKIIYDSSGY